MNLKQMLNVDWQDVLEETINSPVFQQLEQKVLAAYAKGNVHPNREDVFNALNHVRPETVKVVILGQDPYHGEGQANGFSFSVNPGVALPPSLRNIFKELTDDLGNALLETGDLTPWADQGILLLNTVLTVEEGQANAHKGWGWEIFTDAVLEVINQQERPVIFILWGKQAQSKKKMINQKKHHIIEAPHPSPLSAYRGFFGSRPFSKVNQLLEAEGQTPIHWEIKANKKS